MKIGILTQPLSTNYGGLLQAYALQSVLRKIGHQALTIDKSEKKVTIFVRIFSLIKRLLKVIFLGKQVIIRIWPTNKERNIIAQHTDRFIRENILTTKKIDRLSGKKKLHEYKFEAYIVGSDQVWRPSYSPCITNCFFDFLGDKRIGIKTIAYAASFGNDKWEFSKKETYQCSILAKKLSSISVREDSGIKLCQENLGVKSIQVLDPTMLLDKMEYIHLVEKDNVQKSNGNLMTYILDSSEEKKTIITRIEEKLNLISFTVMPKSKFVNVGKKHIQDCVFPPVTKWIKGFSDAKFVITDSFHGTVFSIIFNKPFIVIGNNKRGLSRFISLLRIFHLENRLINSIGELNDNLMHKSIDFERVNDILKKEQEKSTAFILNALK